MVLENSHRSDWGGTRLFARALFSVLFIVFAIAPGLSDDAAARQKYAGIVVDANSGKVIYARNADSRRYPASLTKMMTLYVLFEEMQAGRISKSTMFPVSRHAAAQAPSKLGLKPGQSISADNAIKALATKSANDVAVVIAEALGKTESGFARRMTATARRIGMKRTTFRNASGLPDSKQVTTARDMATLGLRLQRDFPKYYSYFRIRSFTYRGRTYRTHNRLLGRFKGTDGIKTGYTRASGFNLTSSVRRGRKHLIGVVLGGRTGRSRDRQMQAILTDALPKASTRRPAKAKRQAEPKRIAKVPVPVPNPNSLNTLTAKDKAVPVTAPGKPAVITEPASAVLGSMTSFISEHQVEPAVEAKQKTKPEAPTKTVSASPVSRGDETGGTWSIQIGAFSSRADAKRRLTTARKSGVSTLVGKKAIMLAYNKEDHVIYRARFAGFDQTTAKRACNALSRKSINCYALAP